MSQSRQLAAILFTDIVGYTALMQENEQKAVELIKHYSAALERAVNEHEGKVLNYYGDGSLCTFPSATAAVTCAIDLQKDLQSNPTVPLRIGLHVGEIIFEDGKALGDGVNIASRIQSLGQANTILFSKEIYDKIKNHPEFKAVSLGLFDFKNVDESMEVFALLNEGLEVPKRNEITGKLKEVQNKSSKKIIITAAVVILLVIAGFLYRNFSGKTSVNKEKTIAILPFKNISVNKEENEPFCVGVALALQNKLELLGALIPISPQSVEKFRDTKLSIADIAKELGDISYILQGNVLRNMNKIKVYVSLADAHSGNEILNRDYNGDIEDFFSLQENIAQQVASELEVKITPDEQTHIERVATRSEAAIDAYNDALISYVKLVTAVHPLYFDSLPSNPQLYSEYRKTLSFCDRVISLDTSMAEAYVLKGQTYFYSINDWFAADNKKAQISDTVKLLANKALHIDKYSASAYLLISKCFGFRFLDSALTYAQKALAINANNFDVNRLLGFYYIWTDPEKGIRFCKKAIRLNPLSVWTPLVYSDLGFAYHAFGDFEKAELYNKKAIELANNSIITIETTRSLAQVYLHWGKADSAIKYAKQYANQNVTREVNALYEIAEAYCNLRNDCAKAVELYEELWRRYPNHKTIGRWAVALMNIGKTKEAKEKIELAIKELKDRNDTLSYDYAGICALNGDKEKAMSILGTWDWKWGSVYLVKYDKLFDNLRNEKEFKDIVQKALEEKTKLREKIKMMEEHGEL